MNQSLPARLSGNTALLNSVNFSPSIGYLEITANPLHLSMDTVPHLQRTKLYQRVSKTSSATTKNKRGCSQTKYIDKILPIIDPLPLVEICTEYSHLFNKHGAWNKRGVGAKVAKSLKVELGINMEGGIFWKKLVHKSNKQEVEVGRLKELGISM